MYTCPMHPEFRQELPGNCPKCGMNLIPEAETSIKHSTTHEGSKSFFVQYKPLFIIIALIVLPSAVNALDFSTNGFDMMQFMQNWMAGFFLVFSGFKLLDTAGFAEGYSQYDLLAKHWKGYGYIYPFLELALGLLYLQFPLHTVLNLFTLALMVFSGIGVAIKISKHEKFECACLGTFIKVPLTKVTLVEDFGMALMAALMLILS